MPVADQFGVRVTSTGEPESKRASYNRYMRSGKWSRIRNLVFRRAGGLCEGCLTNEPTDVHHHSYEDFEHEFMWQLKALCAACHGRWHLNRRLEEIESRDIPEEIKAQRREGARRWYKNASEVIVGHRNVRRLVVEIGKAIGASDYWTLTMSCGHAILYRSRRQPRLRYKSSGNPRTVVCKEC